MAAAGSASSPTWCSVTYSRHEPPDGQRLDGGRDDGGVSLVTLDVGALVGIALAAASTLVYVGRSLEAMRVLTASNKSQGERLGHLEDWKAASEAVSAYRAHRTLSRAHGVPITDDETPT